MLVTAQVIVLLAVSPFLVGLIRKVKARFQCRRGASIFQPYADIANSSGSSRDFDDDLLDLPCDAYILFASTLSAVCWFPRSSHRHH